MFAGIFFALVLLVHAASAQVQSLRLTGTAGYLSEWELNAEVTREPSGASEQFSGPLRMKHVGLCTVNGPEEKSGKLTVQITRSAASSRLQASLLLDDGARCDYTGQWSGRSAGTKSTGTMDCSNAKGIPLTLSAE
ncbi:MAG TPA: hypothetical protein VGH39_02505 [Xanthobacteraceae bacterium]|jgi:hypothetical protein